MRMVGYLVFSQPISLIFTLHLSPSPSAKSVAWRLDAMIPSTMLTLWKLPIYHDGSVITWTPFLPLLRCPGCLGIGRAVHPILSRLEPVFKQGRNQVAIFAHFHVEAKSHRPRPFLRSQSWSSNSHPCCNRGRSTANEVPSQKHLVPWDVFRPPEMDKRKHEVHSLKLT